MAMISRNRAIAILDKVYGIRKYREQEILQLMKTYEPPQHNFLIEPKKKLTPEEKRQKFNDFGNYQ